MLTLLAIWKGFKSFLAVNWKWVVIGVVLLFVYFKLTSWYDAYTEQRENERAALTSAALRVQAAELSNQSMQATMMYMLDQQRKTEMLLLDAIRRQDEIRAEAKAQVDVFENHDLPKLVQAKPGLIEKLANKATAERLQEIEDALND
jgi:hypothetical protein